MTLRKFLPMILPPLKITLTKRYDLNKRMSSLRQLEAAVTNGIEQLKKSDLSIDQERIYFYY